MTPTPPSAARALVRIQGLVGPEAVVTPLLDGGRGPAERVRLIPWGEPRRPVAGDRPCGSSVRPGPGWCTRRCPRRGERAPARIQVVLKGGEDDFALLLRASAGLIHNGQ
ncbi:hypothetical protein [Amycolatopsis sp. NPDC051128]|uniref:hypothetical protein n=1 Tax=Amycolatopsis sp. NPDC051128 TaxID=3155412 RepID=UPI00342951FA